MAKPQPFTPPGLVGRVHTSALQCSIGASPEVGSFRIGDYQVCEKWLKDRKGRTLDYADIQHYQRTVVARSETIRLMAAIDQTIKVLAGGVDVFGEVVCAALPDENSNGLAG